MKNNEILELLIYGAYIEEQSKLDEKEKQIMYDDINYYYQEGQKEVLKVQKKKKPISIIDMALFLYLLEQSNLKQYIQMTIQNNVQQIYKQALINIQQQKELEIENNEFQRIINQQQNTKLCINGDKISGFMDNQLIGLNNQAKVEGIRKLDKKAKCKFISDMCEHVTPMCANMNGYIFSIDDWNEFDRWYGETAKHLKLERMNVKGLVLGINLPPITHHFHWCHSTIVYQVAKNHIELKQDKKFSLFESKFEKEIKNKYKLSKLNIKHIDKTVLKELLSNMENVYDDFPQIGNKVKQIKEIEHPSGGIAIELQKDGAYIMYINKNTFYNGKIAKQLYERDEKSHYHPKGTTYKDMSIHEAGHIAVIEIIKKLNNNNNNAIVFDDQNNITVNKILNQSFAKIGVNDIIEKNILIKNISKYAYKEKGQEIIAEAFADYYTNKNKATLLSRAIVEIMKGMI